MTLSPLFHSHAVLQAGEPLVIHGTATPFAQVEVSLGATSGTGRADAGGQWRVTLAALLPGGPFLLRARCGAVEHVSEDVWLGEVWLGSGQSNMEWTLSQLPDAAPEIAAADFPSLRFFIVPQNRSPGPLTADNARWQVCTPANAPRFSAVAYHFARDLARHRTGAFGMIVSAWGGTEIASWMPASALRAEPAFTELAADLPVGGGAPSSDFYVDAGPTREASGWASPALDERDWQPMPVGDAWQNHGWALNGAVWFRRRVTVPADWAGRALRLELGRLDDFDDTFWHGVRIGGLDATTPDTWNIPRSYPVPAGLVHSGEVVIAVRVFDRYGGGGFTGPRSALRLFPADAPHEAISLQESWIAKIELALPLLNLRVASPGELFASMINPLRDQALRGVLWYQGESDHSRAALYARLLRAMIAAWRQTWNRSLPFGIVQLPGFEPPSVLDGQTRWPGLREAQAQAVRATSDTGLIVTLDLGDRHDIHPAGKRAVGERLARWARASVYQENITPGGPVFSGAEQSPSGRRLHFHHARGLRTRDGGPVLGFESASSHDQPFVPVAASIEGETILLPAVRSDHAFVRYAWADFPAINLENDEALPAAPIAAFYISAAMPAPESPPAQPLLAASR